MTTVTRAEAIMGLILVTMGPFPVIIFGYGGTIYATMNWFSDVKYFMNKRTGSKYLVF
jgi:hypothetical protein